MGSADSRGQVEEAVDCMDQVDKIVEHTDQVGDAVEEAAEEKASFRLPKAAPTVLLPLRTWDRIAPCP